MKFYIATIAIDHYNDESNKKYNGKNQLARSEHNIVILQLSKIQ